MGLQITEMTATNHDEVVAFWKEQEGVGLNQSDGPQQIAAYLMRNQGMSLIARDQGNVVAAILCGHDGRRGYLHHLAVARSYRGRGIGRSLVERCLERLGRDGIAKCNVFVFGDNCRGQQFWEAIGFKVRNDLKLLQRETSVPRPAAGRSRRLTTDRLILRDFVAEDWLAVHVYGIDPEVTRYMVWGPNTEQQTKDYLERTMARAGLSSRRAHDFAVVLKDGDRLIGACSLTDEGAEAKEAMLGYVYAREHWGNGYATEAAGAVLRFGFETLGLHRIYSTADVLNVASWRVMEKLGMQREGLLREHVLSKGRWRNSYLYGILEHEWRKQLSGT